MQISNVIYMYVCTYRAAEFPSIFLRSLSGGIYTVAGRPETSVLVFLALRPVETRTSRTIYSICATGPLKMASGMPFTYIHTYIHTVRIYILNCALHIFKLCIRTYIHIHLPKIKQCGCYSNTCITHTELVYTVHMYSHHKYFHSHICIHTYIHTYSHTSLNPS